MGIKTTLALDSEQPDIALDELAGFVALAGRLGVTTITLERDPDDAGYPVTGLSFESDGAASLAPMRPDGGEVGGWLAAIDKVLDNDGDARGALYELRQVREHLNLLY